MTGQWWDDDNESEPTPPHPSTAPEPDRSPTTQARPAGSGDTEAPLSNATQLTQESPRGNVTLGIAIAAVLSLIGGLLVVDSLAGESSETVAQGEIFLERADEAGDDPFFDEYPTLVSFDPFEVSPPGATSPASNVAPTPADPAPAAPAPAAAPEPLTNAEILALTFEGGEPGLYGGTGNNASCNKAALIAFLETSPAKASAWAGAQGIATTEIREFVESLTTVVLLADTRVTNHGFKNGVANPIQSVLQAGTAVMIDATGTPRVKCGCGNPLARPIAQSRTVVLRGDPWPEFDQSRIATIEPEDSPVEVFVLRDPGTGTAVERPSGTAGEADVVTSLLAPRPTDDLTVGISGAGAESANATEAETDPDQSPDGDEPTATATTAPPSSAPSETAPPSTLAGSTYCEKYGNYVAEGAQLWLDSSDGLLDFMQRAVAELAQSSPPELRAEWELLESVYSDVTADQIDTFQEDARTAEASASVVQHAEDVCGIDFG